MRRFSLIPAGLGVFALLNGAAAGVRPRAATSTVPSCIALVGTKAGIADSSGGCTMVIRDFLSYPVASSTVILDFSRCPGIRIATNQTYAGATVDCSVPWVRGVTDAQGRVTFRIIGVAGAANPSVYEGATVYADAVLLASHLPVHAYDLDGYNGVDGNDLSVWLADVFSGTSHPEADYDCNGTLGGNDLSLWLAAKWAGGSAESAAPTCGP